MAATQQQVLARAMNASLGIGVLMLIAKWIAFVMTGSSVIFSDAAESVVHIVAVWFAWYALRVTNRPPDAEHHYGHDKINFVSAGVEGGLITIAALVIIVSATHKLLTHIELEQLEIGSAITAGCGLVNGALGWYLVRSGRRHRSLIVESNGKHVLTDVWTSLGAVVGLVLAMWTGQLWIDPVMAIFFGANILYTGAGLMRLSVNGLMDTADPVIEARAREIITAFCASHQCSFHRLRVRLGGNVAHLDFHLQLDDMMPMQEAHTLATQLEDLIRQEFGPATEVFTHLESMTQPDGHI